MDLWECALGLKVGVGMIEDYETSAVVVNIASSPTTRHLARTHGVNVAWLDETLQKPDFRLYVQPTLGQSGNAIFFWRARRRGRL